MAEGGEIPYDPDTERLKFEHDLAEAGARQETWRNRFGAFQAQSTLNVGPSDQRPGWKKFGVDYTGPQYQWMRPENLGDYVLFRLDGMERAGGSEIEKEQQRELAATGGQPGSQDGRHTLSLRLAQIGMEVEWWGQDTYADFRQVRNALEGRHPAQRKFLTPGQAPLVQALDRRVERYNDPRWQRWAREARERKPGQPAE